MKKHSNKSIAKLEKEGEKLKDLIVFGVTLYGLCVIALLLYSIYLIFKG